MYKSVCTVSLLALAFACKKDFDHPPLKQPAEGEGLSVSQLKSRVTAGSPLHHFASGDSSLVVTVTADESTGTFYRQLFAVDPEGEALQLNTRSSGGIYTGDKIRINLNATTMKLANGVYSLDSIDLEKNIVKLSSGNEVVPKVSSIVQVLNSPFSGPDLQSQLVELNGVEFAFAHRGKQLGDPVGRNRTDLVLTDCNSNTITLTTSGHANYAGKQAPAGNGRIVAVVSRYNSSMRLELRSMSDLSMSQPACTGSLTTAAGTFVLSAPVPTITENFSACTDLAEYSQAGWINYNESGKTRWKGNVKSVIYKALRATAFGTGEKNKTWLITPPVVYQNGLVLTFKTGIEYFKTGHIEPVMAFISTNFDGTNLKSANWTPLTNAYYAGSSDGNYTGPGGLRSSGEIRLKDLPLLNGHNGSFHVAFVYNGEPGFDTNVYLDDVVIK